jgi:hypothetical protein
MRLPSSFYQIEHTLQQHFGLLRPAQQRGLALWVYGTLLAGSACQNAVLTALLNWASWHTLRQALREWLYDGADKAAPCHTQVQLRAGCAGLIQWVVTLWTDRQVFLALDATGHRDRLTVLTLSVLYRGSALPLAWTVLPGNQPGAWNPHWIALLQFVRAYLPDTWHVLVLCDRGLWSPDLFAAICAQGWHPLMRVQNNIVFTPHRQARGPARARVTGVNQAWIGAGTAFSQPTKHLAATLIVLWLPAHKEPCLVLTDLAPEQVGVLWYGLRMWIEAGFRLLKSAGWQWHKTRRTDCARAARHWLVLAVATLLTLACGTQQEPKPAVLADTPRRRSLFRCGLVALQRQLWRGRVGKRLRLSAQPLPEPHPELRIVYHRPIDTG